MSSDLAISVRGLSKAYTIAHDAEKHYTLAEAALAWLKNPLKRSRRETFWALKDVSFEIKKGEVVGIIGRNGAGKSTLLKVLSRITGPTAGEVDLHGRVGSLLEVGTGFHPELTGRENIYLNGAILGMRRAEIRKQFDAIVDFAETEQFLDTPVKRYSSGMYVRLAFAVAAHLTPEILIVDEVLAVGDATFQKKCLGKMKEVGATGRTVLFVSHNMSVIQALCGECILLANGRIAFKGSTAEGVEQYLADPSAASQFIREPRQDADASIVEGAVIVSANSLSRVELTIHASTRVLSSVDLRITDASGGTVAFGSIGALRFADAVEFKPGVTKVTLAIDLSRLAVGTYFCSIDLTVPTVRYIDRLDRALTFEVVRAPSAGAERVLDQRWGYGSYEIPVSVLELHEPKEEGCVLLER
jgi:lipopolysaccharide transport system ATP-binding protein